MSLTGRSALVTGGGRGIGAATAMALAEAGAGVAVAARSSEQIEHVTAEIRARGHTAIGLVCDVSVEAEVDELISSTRGALGQIDILVNNAGAASSSPLGRTTTEEWERIMAVNATGTFLCTRAVFDAMVGRGWGRVVNVASTTGLKGGRYIAAYTAAKHAVVGFTRSAAEEASGTGVTVSAVCPGYVDTPLTDQTIANIVERTGMSEEQARATILKHSGQRRLIEPGEVASAIVELCLAGPERNGELVVLDGKEA